VAGIGAVVGIVGVAVGQWLGRTSGSTRAERRRPLPGDELVVAPGLVTNHAATLDASADQVWPWLTQVGWHRAGWYTPRWVDQLLFPDNRPSARTLDARYVRDLQPGDEIPDGPPGTAHFVVEQVEPPRLLVLHSTTHLPQGWKARFGAQLDWVWIFSLTPVGEARTRFQLRNRGWVRPWWLNLGYQAVIVPADHVMARGMLRGLQARVASPESAVPQ
jgi:hypothetical protein